jgi:hypothetical protein
MRNSRTLLSAALLMAMAIVAQAQAPTRPPGEKTQPLDPLTPAEQKLAGSLAEGDRRVQAAVGRTSRRIYIEYIAVKPADTPPSRDVPDTGRNAEVLYLRYDTNVAVRVLVDLTAKRVVDVVTSPGRSAPINLDEVEEAARLALADARVTRLLGERASSFRVARAPATAEAREENRIEGLRTLGATPEDPCYEHRCIELFFREGGRYTHMHEVVVDLSARRVMLRGGAS